jgi:hypothetical protein
MPNRRILVVYPKKKGNLSEEEKKQEGVGDHWTFVNVMPRSSFIQTVHHGKRNLKETEEFVEKIKENSDGQAPLFLSDGFGEYESALKKTYSFFNAETQELEIEPQLKYAQIIKHKKGGKLESIEERIIFGKREEILKIIEEEGRGKKLNTSYVESRNGNYRKENKRLTRKTQCYSKKVKFHEAQIDWITGVYNFCRENTSFRELYNEQAKRFETKYTKRSPAMVEGMADRIYTIEELLMKRAA